MGNKNQLNYSVTEVAKLKGIPYWTVIRQLKKGAYPGAYKVGHGWVIPAGAVK